MKEEISLTGVEKICWNAIAAKKKESKEGSDGCFGKEVENLTRNAVQPL